MANIPTEYINPIPLERYKGRPSAERDYQPMPVKRQSDPREWSPQPMPGAGAIRFPGFPNYRQPMPPREEVTYQPFGVNSGGMYEDYTNPLRFFQELLAGRTYGQGQYHPYQGYNQNYGQSQFYQDLLSRLYNR